MRHPWSPPLKNGDGLPLWEFDVAAKWSQCLSQLHSVPFFTWSLDSTQQAKVCSLVGQFKSPYTSNREDKLIVPS